MKTRTTLTFDSDVLELAKEKSEKERLSLSSFVNRALAERLSR